MVPHPHKAEGERREPVDRVAAGFSTAFRHLLMVPIWFLRMYGAGMDNWPGDVAVIILDIILAVLYFAWVNKPLEIAVGERFGTRASLTSSLMAFGALASFLALRDLWFLLQPVFQ